MNCYFLYPQNQGAAEVSSPKGVTLVEKSAPSHILEVTGAGTEEGKRFHRPSEADGVEGWKRT